MNGSSWLPLGLSMGAGASIGTGVAIWAAVHPAAQLFGTTTRRTSQSDTIGLTFDDGPNPTITPQLLDLLDRHDVRATFFVIGRWVRTCPDLVREIAARGHALANHTDSHPNLVWLSTRGVTDELLRCQDAIERAASILPGAMRPPFGFRGPQLPSAVRRSGLRQVVTWSCIGRDWSPRGQARLVDRLARVTGGDIVVLHDGSHQTITADRSSTLRALEYWLPRWNDRGLRWETFA